MVPATLSDREKLEILRELDRFRDWPSLDEKRFCLLCRNLITGRSIQVVKEHSLSGSMQLACPTEGCNAIPMDWILPTEQVLAAFSKRTLRTRRVVEFVDFQNASGE